MDTLTITLQNPINVSIDVGDELYFTNPSINFIESSFDVSDVTSTNQLIGEVQSITENQNSTSIICSYTNGDPTPTQDSFIMFKKNKKINTSSLKGYYSRVEFKNNSTFPASMYACTCRMIESSK
jgi:hypothetical protein